MKIKVKNVKEAIRVLKMNNIKVISKNYTQGETGYIEVDNNQAQSLLGGMGLLIREQMQFKMMNILNKIIDEKKKILLDEEEKVCENCGECHDELEECADITEQSTTAGIAMANGPLKLSESVEIQKLSEAIKLLKSVVNLFGREYGKGKLYGEDTIGGKVIQDVKKWLTKNK